MIKGAIVTILVIGFVAFIIWAFWQTYEWLRNPERLARKEARRQARRARRNQKRNQ